MFIILIFDLIFSGTIIAEPPLGLPPSIFDFSAPFPITAEFSRFFESFLRFFFIDKMFLYTDHIVIVTIVHNDTIQDIEAVGT